MESILEAALLLLITTVSYAHVNTGILAPRDILATVKLQNFKIGMWLNQMGLDIAGVENTANLKLS